MKKKSIILTLICLAVSVTFTILVCLVDVAPVGLVGTSLGFSHINTSVASVFPENHLFFLISDILGYICIIPALFFAFLGARDLFKKKSLKKVDSTYIYLGLIYIITILIYIIFSKFAINYRPVFENGLLESSYPSSHTVLALVIAGTTIFTLPHLEIKFVGSHQKLLKIALLSLCFLTVAFRFLSGYHWLTDIIGAILIASTLISFYRTAVLNS